MKKLILTLVAAMSLVGAGFSQYATINYDLQKNYFNEGQLLPAEKPLMFTGLVPEGVDIIEIEIFPSKAKNDKDLLYLATWKDFDQNENANYSLAVSYPLRASEKYDFRIDYYQTMEPRAQEALTRRIVDQAAAYLDANIIVKGNSAGITKSKNKMARELEAIISDALKDYRNQQDMGFDGLSETVRQKLANLTSIDFGKDVSNVLAATKEIEALKAVMERDLQELMSKPWSKLFISRYVDDYETEKKKGVFSFNLGYGGVYLDGQLDDLTYGSSPYVGVALPLSNSAIASKFLRNSSIVMGAFLRTFEDESGNKVGGVIIDRPLYLGLDYKLFDFIHFNAGGAFLEKTESLPANGAVGKNTLIRPFIGLSARIDLSIGLGR